MNSLYLILIGISFTAGVLATTMSNENNTCMKPICEDKKTKTEDNFKVVTHEENTLGSWFPFKKH